MARAGMRISEVLNLAPGDIDERELILQKPKSGIRGEVVYIPSKLQRRLNDYIRDNDIRSDDRVLLKLSCWKRRPWLARQGHRL